MVRYYIIRKTNFGLYPVYAAYTPSGAAVKHERKNIVGETPSDVRRIVKALPTPYIELTKPDVRGVPVPKGAYNAYAKLPAGHGDKREIDRHIGVALREDIQRVNKGKTKKYFPKDITLRTYNDAALRDLGVRPNKLARNMIYQAEITDELKRLTARTGDGIEMIKRIGKMGAGRRLRDYKRRGVVADTRYAFTEDGTPLRPYRPRKKKVRIVL